MVQRQPSPRTARSSRGPNTLMNALIGAVVTVVAAPLLPFAAVVGGFVAGYLQRRDLAGGAKVGALSGTMAAVPAFLLAWMLAGILLLGADPIGALSSLFAVVVFVAVAGYLVGAGALGGALGAYIRKEL